MKRGEVRWYEFRPPDKKRPVLILTRTSALAYLNEVTIAPLTTTIRDIPSEVVVGKADGLPADSAINLDHVQTVAKSKLGKLITTLSTERMEQARKAMSFALGFD